MTGVLAGAAVAAQVGSGLSLDALFARQVEPALQAREISDELDMEKFAAEFGALLTRMTSAESAQEAQRRATVGSRVASAGGGPRCARGCPGRTGRRGGCCWSRPPPRPARRACSTASPGST